MTVTLYCGPPDIVELLFRQTLDEQEQPEVSFGQLEKRIERASIDLSNDLASLGLPIPTARPVPVTTGWLCLELITTERVLEQLLFIKSTSVQQTGSLYSKDAKIIREIWQRRRANLYGGLLVSVLTANPAVLETASFVTVAQDLAADTTGFTPAADTVPSDVTLLRIARRSSAYCRAVAFQLGLRQAEVELDGNARAIFRKIVIEDVSPHCHRIRSEAAYNVEAQDQTTNLFGVAHGPDGSVRKLEQSRYPLLYKASDLA